MYEYKRTFTPPFVPASHVTGTHLPLHIIICNKSGGGVYNYTAWKNINATEFTDQKLLYKNVSLHVFIRGCSECGLSSSCGMWLGRWIPRLGRKVLPQYCGI